MIIDILLVASRPLLLAFLYVRARLPSLPRSPITVAAQIGRLGTAIPRGHLPRPASRAAPRIVSGAGGELTMPERVEIIGPAGERYIEVLSPKALELLARL